jgi:hypothetical protein
MDDGKAILGESWSALLSAIAKAEHPEILRLELAACLDAALGMAADPPSPAGGGAPLPQPGGADCDRRSRTRDCTPLGADFEDFAQSLRVARMGLTRRARQVSAVQRRLSEAATARQAAHWAWAQARSELRAIEEDRPADAHGFWCLAAVTMARLAADVPVRHAPEEYRNLGGALPRFAGVPGKET